MSESVCVCAMLNASICVLYVYLLQLESVALLLMNQMALQFVVYFYIHNAGVLDLVLFSIVYISVLLWLRQTNVNLSERRFRRQRKTKNQTKPNQRKKGGKNNAKKIIQISVCA